MAEEKTKVRKFYETGRWWKIPLTIFVGFIVLMTISDIVTPKSVRTERLKNEVSELEKTIEQKDLELGTAKSFKQEEINSLTAKNVELIKQRDNLQELLESVRVTPGKEQAEKNLEAAKQAAAEKAAAEKAAAEKAAAEKAAAEKAATTFGDGTYLVGIDIEPGEYRGKVTNTLTKIGYWARLSGTSGELSEVIANGVPTGPFVLTIQASDKAIQITGAKLEKM